MSENKQPVETMVPCNLKYQTVLLINRLKEGRPGDELTDEELEKICGQSTRPGTRTTPAGPSYGHLKTAIKRCIASHGITWDRVNGEHLIRCLGSVGVMEKAKGAIKSVQRKSRATTMMMGMTQLNGMDETKRAEFSAVAALVGSVALFTTPQARKRLQDKGVQKPLDMAKMLEAMQ